MSTSAPDTGWTISDSEWNGFVERCERQAHKSRFFVPLFVLVPALLLAALFLGFDQWNRVHGGSGWLSPYGRIFWIAIVPLHVVTSVIGMRRLRRHARAAALVRAEDGCVCPACGEPCAPRTADGFAPRCRHGVSRDAQPALIQCWQAMARRDRYAVSRLIAGLPASDRPRGVRARLLRFFLDAASTAADSERPFWERYRAGLVSSLAFLPVMGVMTIMPTLTGGAFMPTMMLPISLGFVAATPFFTMSGATRPSKEERCRACRQLLARVRPARCTECGADLARPAAIESVIQLKQWRFVGVGATIMMLSTTLSMIVSLGIGANMLPTPVLLALAPYSESPSVISALEQRPLSPADQTRLVQMLIGHAAASTRSGDAPLWRSRSSNLVLPAVTAGDLPASTIDDALRAMVALQGTVRATLNGADFVLTPVFGDDLFDRAGDTWVVFRGVSFDGATAVGASTNPIDRWSVDPIWRSGFQRETHPTEFTVSCPLGTHEATWQATLVLIPFAQQPTFSFAADGSLELPANTIRSIEIEGSISVEK